jgi:predicted CXXCH cytochrome family protein
MLTALKSWKSLPRVAFFLMLGVSITGAAQTAIAEFGATPLPLQSTGPCLFSEQLKTSPSIRRHYLTKLVAAVGGTLQAGNSVEQMYGSITPASYTSQDDYDQAEPARDIWGFDKKQKISVTGLDSFSADCLNCHDGVGAVPVTAVLKNNPFGKSHGTLPGSDHPIGMDYNLYASTSREYKSLFGVSNKMVFVNGKVGCLTCHNPLNPEKGHLVMSDKQSALCLTCHNK